MKKIGITGGIGSGKSIVAKILETMNYPVYYSDERSNEVVDTDLEIKEQLIKLIGTEVYQNGKLYRPFLAKQLFSNDDLRLKINEIIHPKVRNAFNLWTEKQTTSLVFNEAAILFETGGYKTLDYTILVTAPLELKIQRVIKRDGFSKDQVLERMIKQWTDEEKIPLADFIIVNDEVKLLLQQVESVLDIVKSKK